MKRLLSFFLLLSVALSQSLWSLSLSDSEAEELRQIVRELKNLNEEQEKIIERSQMRNEQLEKQSSEQEKQIEKLTELSESKQKIIDEQQKTIDALKSSSKEQRKSSSLNWLKNFGAGLGCLLGGFFGGFFFGHLGIGG